jgi:hypothetical protein
VGTRNLPGIIFIIAVSIGIFGCTTETSEKPVGFGSKTDAPRGFFNRLADQLTERECNVIIFSCPYGLGPAGEPCDCTDPDGILRKGWTVK